MLVLNQQRAIRHCSNSNRACTAVGLILLRSADVVEDDQIEHGEGGRLWRKIPAYCFKPLRQVCGSGIEDALASLDESMALVTLPISATLSRWDA